MHIFFQISSAYIIDKPYSVLYARIQHITFRSEHKRTIARAVGII